MSARAIPSIAATSTAATSPLSNPSRGSRRILRRISAVLAGLLAIFAVTTVTDMLMHRSGVFPPVDGPPMSSALFLLALAYRLVFDIAGCYLTARLAPDRPMGHALVLGAIGVLLSMAGLIIMWGRGPAWYPLALAASSLPTAWLGARLRGAR